MTTIKIIQCNLAKADPSPGLAKCCHSDQKGVAKFYKLIVKLIIKGGQGIEKAILELDVVEAILVLRRVNRLPKPQSLFLFKFRVCPSQG